MPELKEGTLLAGRYVLVRRIGSGGMAEVWLAEDRKLESRDNDGTQQCFHRCSSPGLPKCDGLLPGIAAPALIRQCNAVIEICIMFIERVDSETTARSGAG